MDWVGASENRDFETENQKIKFFRVIKKSRNFRNFLTAENNG